MSDEIFFDGKRFVSAAEAASLSGLTRDYIAKLSRESKIIGRRVGKNWYVEYASLRGFLIEQEYAKSLRREALTHERLREYRGESKNAASAIVAPMADAIQSVSVAAAAMPKRAIEAGKTMAGSNHAHHAREMIAKAFAAPGFADAAARLPASIASAAQGAMHVPVYTVTPFMDFVHRLVALTLAFMLTFGTYSLVDPSYARFAAASISNTAYSLKDSYTKLTHGGLTNLAARADSQLALAAENPGETFALLTYNVVHALPNATASLARALNGAVDHYVYAVAFPDALVRSADTGARGTVAVEIQPYAQGNANVSSNIASTASSTSSSAGKTALAQGGTRTIINQPIVERVVEERVLAAGGITEEYLAARLQELDNKLSNKIYGITAVSSAVGPVASGGVVNNIAVSQRIDRLSGVSISGGTLSGAAISGGSISGIDSLSVSGNTSLATTSISGDLTVTGILGVQNISLSSTTVTINGTSGQTANFLDIKNASGTTVFAVQPNGTLISNISSTTQSVSSLLVTGSATATNLVVLELASTSAILATNATTTNATSTNLFSTLAHFTTGIIDTLTASLANITNLTVTNSTTTNATTTNLYSDNFSAATLNTANSIVTYSTSTNATSTNLYAVSGVVDTFRSTLAAVTGLTATNATTTNATTTNLVVSNLTLPTFTQGSIPFVGANGLLSQDNDRLYFDSALHSIRLGGASHTLTGANAAIVGGYFNTASGQYAFLGGGQNNQAQNVYDSVIGGTSNNVNAGNGIIAGGTQNTVTGGSSGIIGGYYNTASGQYTFIGGGQNNQVSDVYAAIVGGASNQATQGYSFIGGGYGNVSNAAYALLAGGQQNTANGGSSALVGGYGNTATGAYSFLGGGQNNQTQDVYDAVVGGNTNIANGGNAFIGAGTNNTASGASSAIAGGYFNTTSGQYTFVGGGQNNSVSDVYSAIVGGASNTIAGSYSFIGGGTGNSVPGAYSVALGRNTTVSGEGSIGIGLDGGSYTVSSNNVFAVLGGKVGVGTTTPWAQLSLSSSAGSPAFVIGSSTTQFIVDKNGNVGIGTVNPQTALDIVGNTYIRNVAGAVGSGDAVEIANDASAPRVSLIQGGRPVGLFSADAPGNTYLKNTAGGSLLLYGSTGGNVELARLTNSGFFGIGTTTPWAQLAVVGGASGAGTIIGADALSGFSGNLLDLKLASTTKFSVNQAGALMLGTALAQQYGGTGIASYAAGDILYADNSGNLAKLPIGSTGNVLTVQAGLPAWGVSAGGGGGGGGGDTLWATTTDNLIYPISTAYPVSIGANATSSAFSIFEVHGIQYNSSKLGIATTSPATDLSVAGSGYFTGGLGIGKLNTTAGTLETSGNATVGGNLTVSSVTGSTLLYANGSKTVSSVSLDPSLTLSLGTLSLNTGNANTFTALQTFANASTTLLSVFGKAYFGGTATSTFASDGSLNVASAFTAYASSTIGDGTQIGGLTISGGATTTAKAYFADTAQIIGQLSVGSVSSAGNFVGISTTTSATDLSSHAALTLSGTYNGSTATHIMRGINAAVTYAGTANSTQTGGFASGGGASNDYNVINSASGFNVARMTAVFARSQTTGSLASTTDSVSFMASVPLISSGNLVTNHYGFWARGGSVSGTLTNNYGLYVDNLNAGTNRYGIYQAGTGDNNYLAGNTGFGTASPWAKLAIANFGTSGTGIGLDATSGFTGNLLDLKVASSSKFTVDQAGNLTSTGLLSFANASTSVLSVFTKAYFGGTATTTIDSAGVLTLANASNNTLLYANGSNQVVSASVGSSLVFSTGALSLNTGNTNSWTALQSFTNASTSIFSANGPAYFGATATSSFSSTGALSLVSNGLTVGTSQLVVSGGNVGIGTSDPTSPLHVFASGSAQAAKFDTDSGSSGGYITFAQNGTVTGYVGSGPSLSSSANTANDLAIFAKGALYFNVNNTSASPAMFDTTGNFRLGYSFTPTYKLDVDGNAHFTSFVDATHFVATSSSATSTFAGGITGPGSFVLQQNSGRLGLGTASPWAKLAIANFGTSGTGIGLDATSGFTGNLLDLKVASSSKFTVDQAGNLTSTGLLSFANASTSVLSVFTKAYFGGTATTTIDSAGNVQVAGGLGVGTTNSTAGTIQAVAANTTGTIQALSGASDAYAAFGIGRTTNDGFFAVAGAANNWTSGSAAGDVVVTSNGGGKLSLSGRAIANVANLTLDTAGNVGIGTTTPAWLLNPYSASATQLALSAGAGVAQWAFRNAGGNLYLATTTVAGTATSTFSALSINGSSGNVTVAEAGGNLGIGTSTPFRKLSVTDTVSAAQLAIAYDATRYTQLQTDASGDFVIDPSGNDAFLNDDNMWVCTGGSCPSGSPSGTGNLIVENKIGVGSSTPLATLSAVNTVAAGTDDFILHLANTTGASDARAGVFLQPSTTYEGNFIQSKNNGASNGNLTFGHRSGGTNTVDMTLLGATGYLGIGTTSPSQQLSVQNQIYVGAGGASGMGTATSTFQGDIRITGKLDVGTIDPPYTIDGTKYATYVPSMTGVKEETAQVIELDEQTADGKYAYTINFDEMQRGSDLWLFWQVTDLGAKWQYLTVLLTPSFDGQVYYKKLPGEHKLVVYADQPGEVSMRLTGNRFDFTKWGNVRPDQDGNTEGTHVVPSKAPVGSTAAAAAGL